MANAPAGMRQVLPQHGLVVLRLGRAALAVDDHQLVALVVLAAEVDGHLLRAAVGQRELEAIRVARPGRLDAQVLAGAADALGRRRARRAAPASAGLPSHCRQLAHVGAEVLAGDRGQGLADVQRPARPRSSSSTSGPTASAAREARRATATAAQTTDSLVDSRHSSSGSTARAATSFCRAARRACGSQAARRAHGSRPAAVVRARCGTSSLGGCPDSESRRRLARGAAVTGACGQGRPAEAIIAARKSP